MTNYAAMAKRIRRASTIQDCRNMELSLDRLYHAGIFTESQFMRLDGLILDRAVRFELVEGELKLAASVSDAGES